MGETGYAIKSTVLYRVATAVTPVRVTKHLKSAIQQLERTKGRMAGFVGRARRGGEGEIVSGCIFSSGYDE